MENQGNKQIKASAWALGILLVLSAAVLVMFFGVGFGDMEPIGGKNITSPRYTGLLLIWLYALVALTAGAVLVFGLVNAFRNMRSKTKGQKKTGFAGWVFLFTIAVVAVAYFLADTTPVYTGEQELVDSIWQLTITDVCLYSIYALVLVSILCSVLSMLGLFKSKT